MVGAQIAKEVGLTYRVGETDHPENNLISKIRSGWPSRSAWPFVVHRECSANRNWEEASGLKQRRVRGKLTHMYSAFVFEH